MRSGDDLQSGYRSSARCDLHKAATLEFLWLVIRIGVQLRSYYEHASQQITDIRSFFTTAHGSVHEAIHLGLGEL